jgi:hypothetical protein
MKLSHFSSRGKPQRGEKRIGGGRLGLPPDPFLNLGQTFRGSMDIIPFGNIGKRFEQLLKAIVAVRRLIEYRVAGAASRRVHHRQHPCLASHLHVFLCHIPAGTPTRLVAG